MTRWLAAVFFVLLGACEVLAGIPGSVVRGGNGDGGLDATMGLPEAAGSADAAMDSAPFCPLDADHGDLCYICEDQSCCALGNACRANPACGKYLSCYAKCTTNECAVSCIKTYPEGHDLASPFLGCNELNCFGPCAGDASGSPCSDCQEANCVKDFAACLADPTCDTLRACILACGLGDDTCIAGCKTGVSSQSVGLYNADISCVTTYCSGACK